MGGFGLMRTAVGCRIMHGAAPYRRSWPYFRTPIVAFLVVMAPICGMMAVIVVGDTPSWMTWSAGVVVAITFLTLYQGYARRLILSERGARFVGGWRTVEIEWSEVRGAGVYVPGGGLGAVEYVYITKRESPPAGKWDRGQDTIQLQNRPGLIEAIEAARRPHAPDRQTPPEAA
jgi:hypothetical protein